MDAIRGGTPVLLASKTFGVPRITLRRKIEVKKTKNEKKIEKLKNKKNSNKTSK